MMKNYQENFLVWEWVFAMLIAAFTAIASEFVVGRDYLSDLLTDRRTVLYATVASIGGSLIGFIITALSIVVGLVQGPLFTALRKEPSYRMLFSIFFQTIIALALATGISLVGIIIDRGETTSPWILYALWWALILSLFPTVSHSLGAQKNHRNTIQRAKLSE